MEWRGEGECGVSKVKGEHAWGRAVVECARAVGEGARGGGRARVCSEAKERSMRWWCCLEWSEVWGSGVERVRRV